jgi:hypothetical protein
VWRKPRAAPGGGGRARAAHNREVVYSNCRHRGNGGGHSPHNCPKKLFPGTKKNSRKTRLAFLYNL